MVRVFYFKAMIQGRKKVKLTPDSILDKISEYDIYKFYMPHQNWKINVVTYSPFRNEKNPSFIIGYRGGALRYCDFGDSSKKGGCFNFVMMLFNVNLNDALLMIDRDFDLGIISGSSTKQYERIVSDYAQPTATSKREFFIQVKTRKFTNEELAYWNGYYQDIDDLRANNVYSIDTVYLNKQKFPIKDSELRFGYLYEGHWKIYRPFADKKNKWMPNNVPITMMDGLDDIKDCDVAFINKSKKDYMVMKKIYPCCCAVQNEGMGCFSEENVEYIKENSERQILSFDSDETGVKNSQMITDKFGFEYCNVPRLYLDEGIKDWADLARIHGLKTIEKYLTQKEII
jgi:DNA primase